MKRHCGRCACGNLRGGANNRQGRVAKSNNRNAKVDNTGSKTDRAHNTHHIAERDALSATMAHRGSALLSLLPLLLLWALCGTARARDACDETGAARACNDAFDYCAKHMRVPQTSALEGDPEFAARMAEYPERLEALRKKQAARELCVLCLPVLARCLSEANCTGANSTSFQRYADQCVNGSQCLECPFVEMPQAQDWRTPRTSKRRALGLYVMRFLARTKQFILRTKQFLYNVLTAAARFFQNMATKPMTSVRQIHEMMTKPITAARRTKKRLLERLFPWQ